MKISYSSDHLSITKFDEIETQDLVVLTGVNGAGKSHLLDAIFQKKVLIDARSDNKVVTFNFENFRLKNEASFNAQKISAERDQAWNILQDQLKALILNEKNVLGKEYDELRERAISLSVPLWSLQDSQNLDKFKHTMNNIFVHNHQFKGNIQAQSVFRLLKELPYLITEINKEEFDSLYKQTEKNGDFLPAALGRLIWGYYIKYSQNQLNELNNTKYKTNHKVLTEAEFISSHGKKPWDVINSILSGFQSLDYKINSPEGGDLFSNYQLKLTSKSKPDLQIEFNDLSSGERILMALVASIYKASFDNNFPDVILLDEIDASLHPSMIKNMLSVIQDIFLAQGIKVVLVTHSPTTIALAPEECIYVMDKSGEQRIQKAHKKNALSILTEGFATLSDGIMIFDEVVRSPVSVLTEGNNTKFLKKAFSFYGVEGVNIVEGAESITGQDQLKTLFNFFCKIQHENSVIFIWDCDVNYKFEEENNTFPIKIKKNNDNLIAKKGIENAFPISLFDGFKTTTIKSDGTEIVVFDKDRKRDFEEFILNRNCKDDFAWFGPVCEKIKSIQNARSDTTSSTVQAGE